ncbi:MAG TPA: LamG-like jellyroll fold domain-containing protein [Flavobacteriales bacterium]|nr:LamG-like jellyroll fold domain-containing protein [Flavobacteriales bacterium]
MVSSYPFNGNANDATGSYNGTVNGATLTTDRFGNSNSAYNFDGDDYIQVNEEFDYPEKTVCLWFNAGPTTSTGGCIFNMDNPTLIHGNMGATVFSSGSDHYLHVFAGGTTANQFDVLINTNQWYHLAMTKDTAGFKIYLDCNLITTFAPANNVSSTGDDNQTRFGSDRILFRFFNGKINSISITNCALTAAEVCNKYNALSDVVQPKEIFNVYPNPVMAGTLLDYTIIGKETSILEITNALGEKIYSQSVNASGTVYLDPAIFTPGIYLASLKNAGLQTHTAQKFIVE